VYMCTELLPPGGCPIAVKYIISYIMWPIQFAFRLLISCRIFLCSLRTVHKYIWKQHTAASFLLEELTIVLITEFPVSYWIIRFIATSTTGSHWTISYAR
jgi:hypothetical protein